jgi:hypothetical protein
MMIAEIPRAIKATPAIHAMARRTLIILLLMEKGGRRGARPRSHIYWAAAVPAAAAALSPVANTVQPVIPAPMLAPRVGTAPAAAAAPAAAQQSASVPSNGRPEFSSRVPLTALHVLRVGKKGNPWATPTKWRYDS